MNTIVSNTVKSQVTTIANKLAKAMGRSEAFKKAWTVIKVRQQMKSGVVSIRYKKADGSLRAASATLCKEHMPEMPTSNSSPTIFRGTAVIYYDLDKGQFRQFQAQRFICTGA